MKTIELHRSVTDSNDRDAQKLREELKEAGVLLINIMSAAGSGKTTFLSKTVKMLEDPWKIAVLECDIDSDVDALKMEELGVRSIQVHTDGMCHMDAGMTRGALEAVDLEGLEIAFLENVGNLICPAEYDTGAVKKVMILSVPEGDDKPLKYPLMFKESDVLIISKIDALPYFNFDMDKCIERVKYLNKNIRIFPVSAKTGEGMEAWIEWLNKEKELWRGEN
ncbi:MAG: hydrogenase nickel incorporation protein HypB [Erysipelotrichaceae bacterium]|nr:hydrogenase nickel incorporation protein HypB [Erysipelotrichaceae bacterium]